MREEGGGRYALLEKGSGDRGQTASQRRFQR